MLVMSYSCSFISGERRNYFSKFGHFLLNSIFGDQFSHTKKSNSAIAACNRKC